MKTKINGVVVPYEKTTSELIEMLGCEMPLFRVSCEALSHKTDELSFEALLGVVKSGDQFKRRVGLECLGNHIMFDKAADVVMACLEDESPYVVKTAIEAAIKHRIERAHEKLIRLLKSKDESIREAATVALEFINEENNFDMALALYNDRNTKIRKIIPHIILAIANDVNWKKAYDMMKCDDNDKARLVACKLLLKFGTKIEKEEIRSFSHDKNGHIRKLSLRHDP